MTKLSARGDSFIWWFYMTYADKAKKYGLSLEELYEIFEKDNET